MTAKDEFLKFTLMPDDERCRIIDSGVFNSIIRGYCVAGMKEAGCSHSDIHKTMNALSRVFDEVSAAEAKKIYDNF